MDECHLGGYGHVEHMANDRLVKKIYGGIGSRRKGRQRKRWPDVVRELIRHGIFLIKMLEECLVDFMQWRHFL